MSQTSEENGSPAKGADSESEEGHVVRVTTDQVAPITHRGGELRVLISPKTAGSRDYIFGSAVLEPGERNSAHVHDYGDESIYVVSGTARLIAEGNELEVGPGECVFIPRGVVHAVENAGDTRLLAIFANGPLAPSPELGHREVDE